MYYGKIKKISILDGPGIRVSLYVSGCRNHCEGCHNPETWDFLFGKPFNKDTEQEILKDLNHEYIAGLTICGGEPMEEENQADILKLLRRVRGKFPDKNIWCYTGYEFEDLLKGGKKYTNVTSELLSYIDVLITGPFILKLRDISDNNRWRGSTNQKIIDVKESLKKKTVSYYKLED